MALPERPITILIAALGGEGGGVLADWIVAAATAQTYPVQSTSIPGVAQRTGATTYYVEIYPAKTAELGGKRPVMTLTPSPAYVDVMVASELLEAGRAMQNGYVTPDRTTLVASTHRIYTVLEKSAMGDGRVDESKILKAADQMAKRAVLFDMAELATQANTVMSAVLFGALAGSGALPLSREVCEAAIKAGGKGIEPSLKGFASGYAHASGEAKPRTPEEVQKLRGEPVERVRQTFPVETHRLIEEGVARVTDFQDQAYANLYLDRLEPVLKAERDAGGGAAGYKVTNETGRFLALWMSYEDVIRVADLKTRKSRFERVRNEVMAKPEEPVQITEFLKPGVEEIAAVLTPGLSKSLVGWAKRTGRIQTLNKGMYVKTTSIRGFLMLRTLAWFKPWRRKTARFIEEQAAIEKWLRAVSTATKEDLGLALEVAQLARLLKGYGDTYQRGRDNFNRIMSTLVGASTIANPSARAHAVRAAREAALADPEGRKLESSLETHGIQPLPPKAKPIQFIRRPTEKRAA